MFVDDGLTAGEFFVFLTVFHVSSEAHITSARQRRNKLCKLEYGKSWIVGGNICWVHPQPPITEIFTTFHFNTIDLGCFRINCGTCRIFWSGENKGSWHFGFLIQKKNKTEQNPEMNNGAGTHSWWKSCIREYSTWLTAFYELFLVLLFIMSCFAFSIAFFTFPC